jgi:transposase
MVEYIRNHGELKHLVITRHAEGWSIRGLARHFAIGRNTVRRILRKNQKAREEGHDVISEIKPVRRASKLDPFLPLIKQLLEQYPNITGVRLYEELIEAGFQGGSTIVTDRLRQMRPRPKKEPIVSFETPPGKQGQMDWSPYTIPFTRSGKQQVLCWVFRADSIWRLPMIANFLP